MYRRAVPGSPRTPPVWKRRPPRRRHPVADALELPPAQAGRGRHRAARCC